MRGRHDLLCLDDDGPPLRARNGAPDPELRHQQPLSAFPAFAARFADGGPYAQLNRTATDTHGFGATLQMTHRATLSAGRTGSCRRQLRRRPHPLPGDAPSSAR